MPDLAKVFKSFGYAFKGIVSLFRYENNAKVHLIAGILAVAAAFYLEFSLIEWCILVIQIALVMAAEAFNTAIEKLCDAISPQKHPAIGTVKDIAAGAVLITAIAAVITGLFLFLPKILQL
ncbi:MAG: diacylglycerol kinase [Cytophagaceae bacterium SCN 52-12]|nr:MAG: diacylglycerol kinase [Cytophagaceae bacterium SCN 52-12]